MLKDLSPYPLDPTSMVDTKVFQSLFYAILSSRYLRCFYSWASNILISLNTVSSYTKYPLLEFENIIISWRRVLSIIYSAKFNCFPRSILSFQFGVSIGSVTLLSPFCAFYSQLSQILHVFFLSRLILVTL